MDQTLSHAVVRYHTDEERDRKLAALPPSVKYIYCIPYEAPSIEAWEAEVKADEARRRREPESESSRTID